MVTHFAFIAFVVAGGFLAWRWPALIWPHLACAGWGLATILVRLDCPLTSLEDWARRRAGQRGLPAGFIDRYINGVVYPVRLHGRVQMLVAVVVVLSWIGPVV
jgi:hypothetical protein